MYLRISQTSDTLFVLSATTMQIHCVICHAYGIIGDMNRRTVTTVLMAVSLWWFFGTHVLCIVHCHWHHQPADTGVGLYVCVHPMSETSSAPPITHQTLSHLSVVLLVTMVSIGMVWVMHLLTTTHRHWASYLPLHQSPPPKPVAI